MALKTLGTNANNSMQGFQFTPGFNGTISAADMATFEQLIVGDNRSGPAIGGRFDWAGLLYLPKDRGVVQVLPGDWVAVDNRGWPVVVRADSIANGAWTHT